MKRNKLIINCDGGSRGNPGPGASAYVVTYKGEVIAKENRYFKKTTNNIAEYLSLILALKWLSSKGSKYFKSNVIIKMDSQLVVKQLSGKYKVKSKVLKPLYNKSKRLIKNIKVPVEIKYVSRNKNKLADKLVNDSIDENT